ncbi:DUF255 domain-containing protein [Paenibacillus caseinilyticus]|nr:DUF255 domain-containing protein [Paenibacillus caseinilyticus]MCZ8521443.1 DUF255 domain-containing protein [Paenibacillus caseinilyticus]
MTGRGGWPLTVILTPDQKPFFAGTYFPKARRHGRRGLMDILSQIWAKWKEDPAKVADIGEQVAAETQKRMIGSREGGLSEALLEKAYQAYEGSFDEVYGGFGGAPKFPASPHETNPPPSLHSYLTNPALNRVTPNSRYALRQVSTYTQPSLLSTSRRI